MPHHPHGHKTMISSRMGITELIGYTCMYMYSILGATRCHRCVRKHIWCVYRLVMVYGIITVTIIIIHKCIGGGGVTIPRTVVFFFQPLLDCMRVGRHSNSTQLRVFMCVLGVGAVHVPWVHGGVGTDTHTHVTRTPDPEFESNTLW